MATDQYRPTAKGNSLSSGISRKEKSSLFFSQESSYYTFRNFCEFVFIALQNWKIGFFSFRLPAGLAQTF
jgi:hypothetical protein